MTFSRELRACVRFVSLSFCFCVLLKVRLNRRGSISMTNAESFLLVNILYFHGVMCSRHPPNFNEKAPFFVKFLNTSSSRLNRTKRERE